MGRRATIGPGTCYNPRVLISIDRESCYARTMTREELIATVTKITELRTEIARLSGLQKELKQLEASLDTVTGVTPPTASGATRQRSTLSIEEKIGQFLDINSQKDWAAEEIAAKVEAKTPTARAALSKLRKAGRIIDTRRGYVQSKKTAAPSEESEFQIEEGITTIEAA
jgi:hypothetical protein